MVANIYMIFFSGPNILINDFNPFEAGCEQNSALGYRHFGFSLQAVRQRSLQYS